MTDSQPNPMPPNTEQPTPKEFVKVVRCVPYQKWRKWHWREEQIITADWYPLIERYLKGRAPQELHEIIRAAATTSIDATMRSVGSALDADTVGKCREELLAKFESDLATMIPLNNQTEQRP